MEDGIVDVSRHYFITIAMFASEGGWQVLAPVLNIVWRWRLTVITAVVRFSRIEQCRILQEGDNTGRRRC